MKRANHVKLICPYWKDNITNNLEPQKPIIYIRNQRFNSANDKPERSDGLVIGWSVLLGVTCTGVGVSGTNGVFAKIDKDGTGIAFVNIENSAATVTMTAYDDNGTTIATETVNLNAHEKKVDIPSNLFTEDISTATYIAYSSSGNVVGFQLNMSSDGMMLDALPGM